MKKSCHDWGRVVPRPEMGHATAGFSRATTGDGSCHDPKRVTPRLDSVMPRLGTGHATTRNGSRHGWIQSCHDRGRVMPRLEPGHATTGARSRHDRSQVTPRPEPGHATTEAGSWYDRERFLPRHGMVLASREEWIQAEIGKRPSFPCTARRSADMNVGVFGERDEQADKNAGSTLVHGRWAGPQGTRDSPRMAASWDQPTSIGLFRFYLNLCLISFLRFGKISSQGQFASVCALAFSDIAD